MTDVDFMLYKLQVRAHDCRWRTWAALTRPWRIELPPEEQRDALPVFHRARKARLSAPDGATYPCVLNFYPFQSREMRAAGLVFLKIKAKHYDGLFGFPKIKDGTISWGDCTIKPIGLRARANKRWKRVDVVEFSTFARLMPTKKTEKR